MKKMMKGQSRERVSLYLKHKEYFDARIMNDSRWKKKKAPIAIMYISTNKTLGQVAIEFDLGRERIRQIVAEFLRKVERIYRVNKKELDQREVKKEEVQVDKLSEIKETIRKLEQGLRELTVLVARIDNESVSITPIELKTIVDDGNEGYLLSNIKTYLGDSYQDFFSWYQGKHYTGGIYEGEYYYLKSQVDEYLSNKGIV